MHYSSRNIDPRLEESRVKVAVMADSLRSEADAHDAVRDVLLLGAIAALLLTAIQAIA